MEIAALIARIAVESTLLRTKIVSIEAVSHKAESPQGGILNTETNAGLEVSTSEGNEVRSTVSIKISGYKKGVLPKNLENAEPIFTIGAVVQGVYEIPKGVLDPKHPNDLIVYILARSIYPIAAAEVRAMAGKLGYTGVKPATDLPKPSEGVFSVENIGSKTPTRKIKRSTPASPKKVGVRVIGKKPPESSK